MSNHAVHNSNLDTAHVIPIAQLEENSSVMLRTFEQSAHLLALACRDAAAMERERRRAGLPEPAPAPWPESTWKFLAHHARRFHS